VVRVFPDPDLKLKLFMLTALVCASAGFAAALLGAALGAHRIIWTKPRD